MSIWHKADDFDIDHTAQEVDFLLSPDYQGNVYLSVSFDQIKCIYERILEKEKAEREKYYPDRFSRGQYEKDTDNL